MAKDLIFYTNPLSRGRIVRWMLEEIGEPYQTELMDFGSLKSDAYRAINPMGKVPAIRHGDVVVTEGAAICAYLADAFPQAGLAPPLGDRGAYYRWLFFAAGPVEAATTNARLQVDAPPELQRMLGYGTLQDTLETLEKAVSASPFIAGDRFSAADVYVGSQVIFGTQFGSIPSRPAFLDYMARLTERPAAVRARQIDDALIPPQPATT